MGCDLATQKWTSTGGLSLQSFNYFLSVLAASGHYPLNRENCQLPAVAIYRGKKCKQTCKVVEVIKANIQKMTNEHLRTQFYPEKQKHPVASSCILLDEATGSRNAKETCLKW